MLGESVDRRRRGEVGFIVEVQDLGPLEAKTPIAREATGAVEDSLGIRLVKARQIALEHDPVAAHKVKVLAKGQRRLKLGHLWKPPAPWTETSDA